MWDGELIRYQPMSGDPLWVGEEMVMTSGGWLEESWDGPFPDACMQLLDQFRAPRTGDMVVVASAGYDFRKRFEVPEHKSGHGSLIRAHMQVPIWTNVPGPPEPIRTVDLFPSMLEWLGEPVPEGIDGQQVWSPEPATTVA
jgi:hypothetical protein